MKHRKLNKYEQRQMNADALRNVQAGTGLYIYRNSSDTADLSLPRPTRTGLRHVRGGEEFQGDDYYMQLVKTGLLRLVKTLQTPEEELNQVNESKLLLEQPSNVTTQGEVEFVVAGEETVLQESTPKSGPKKGKKDVLLNESPDGFIVVGD